MQEWDGTTSAWLEAKSRNHIRGHYSKDQIVAAYRIGVRHLPELAEAEKRLKQEAAERQKAGKSADDAAGGRGRKKEETLGSRDPRVSRAPKVRDIIGAALGVSGGTVERVLRLEREAPELLAKVAGVREDQAPETTRWTARRSLRR